MQRLNFPEYTFRFKNTENKLAIFDPIRRKFILVTPEEWVRQNCIHYLLSEKNIPKSLINVEKKINLNGTHKRYDIVVFRSDGSLFLLVECKAPEIEITQQTFDQIARYNLALQSSFLMVTNGMNHYFCQMDYEKQQYHFLKELPQYQL